MSSSNTLSYINSILRYLHQNIETLNKAKSYITKIYKNKSIQISKPDKKKVLKLFKYSSWEQFMKWTNYKLSESGYIYIEVKENYKYEEPSYFKSKLKSTQCNGYFYDTLNFYLTDYSHEYKRSANSSIYKGYRKNLFHNIHIEKRYDEELQLLALYNGRLRRYNIILKNKLIYIHAAIRE